MFSKTQKTCVLAETEGEPEHDHPEMMLHDEGGHDDSYDYLL